jgi:hypothetical protein
MKNERSKQITGALKQTHIQIVYGLVKPKNFPRFSEAYIVFQQAKSQKYRDNNR